MQANNVVMLRSFQERRDLNPNDELTAKNWLEERVKASEKGVFSEVVDLNPALAAELLKNNEANRNLRTSKLAQYVRDMEAGKWQLNGEPIIVSDKGKLNDGQHRCFAMLEAMKPVKVVMVFGVARDTRMTIDTGAKRAAQDYLTIEGVKNATLAASAARLIIGYKEGKGKFLKGRSEVSTVAIIEKVLADGKIGEAASIIQHLRAKRALQGLGTPAVWTFAYYLFAKKNPGQALNFITAIIHPDRVPEDHPARTVRRQLETLDSRREARAEVIIRGWNLLRSGQTASQIPLVGEFPKVL